MKRFILALVMCFALSVSDGLQAAESSMPVNVKESARKASSCLKMLSREQREAALAELAGLLFMPDGKGAYSSKTSYQNVEEKLKTGTVRGRVPYRRVSSGAQFVGSDGRLYDFYAALPSRGGSAKKKQAWNLAKLYIHYAGEDVLKERFAEDLKNMEVQRAVYFLGKMSPALRQSFFAEMLGLLYTYDDRPAYSGGKREERIAGEMVPYNRVDRSARFLDAEGNAHSYYAVKDKERAKGNSWYTWWTGAKLAVHHGGQERVFAAFSEEIRAMKKHFSAR